ncbi:MAG: hypothetical protein ACREUA_05660, partial [Burkholderiales bacterium]
PVRVMVDAVEEEYRMETLPHVTWRARREMLQRKLKQTMRNSVYQTAWWRGREPDKRRDDRYLFAALSNTDVLQPWLDELRNAPIAGVFLLPMVSGDFVERFKLEARHLLLISRHESGLRQSFFEQGKLRVSRLTPAEALRGDSGAKPYTAEITKTRLYLSNLRLLARDSRMTVCVLDHDGALEELHATLREDPALTVHHFTANDLENKLGIQSGFLEKRADALMLHLLGLKLPDHNLAPKPVTRGYWRLQMRRLLYGISGAVTSIALVVSAADLYLRHDFDAQAAKAAQDTAGFQTRYLKAKRSFPFVPVSAENLQKSVEAVAQLRKQARTPNRLMLVLSRALDPNPIVRLSGLSWDSGLINADNAISRTARETGTVDGDIRPFGGDYRAAITAIDAFVQQLKHDPDVAEVSVLQLPLNVDPNSALSGSAQDNPALLGGAKFRIRLALKDAA